MYGNPSFLSQYGPIDGSFSDASMQKFSNGFGQSQAAPGTVNPLPFGGGNSGGGWGHNQFASMPIGQNFGAGMGEVNFYGDNFPGINFETASTTSDGRGIASVTSVTPAGGSISLLQADQTAPDGNTSDFDVVTRTLKAGTGVTLNLSSDEIEIETSAGTAGDTVIDSDTTTISGATAATKVNAQYDYTTNSGDFFTDSSGGTFDAGTDVSSKFNFGVGRISNPTRSGTSGFHSYSFVRLAGDIDDSGTCFNMLETTVAKGASPGIIGGVNTASSSYPSDFDPAPVQWSDGPDSEVYKKYSLVFIWRDVNNRLGGGAGAHYFQAMQNHDGECPSG